MVKVAILGFGTVGSGVAEVLCGNADKITENAMQDISLKHIVDVREFPDSPFRTLITNDFSVVENDPEVKIVIETIGGTGVAYEFTKRSLMAGKSVVTSNKELVATYGYELMQLAKEKNVTYLFEASVGGGIPIIRPIAQCLAANKINEIYGILNGTTNYILTKMIKEGMPFDTALRQAQEKGYAEANPAADVEGKDTCRKICILASLCFGRHVFPEQVKTEGITEVKLKDVELAAQKGYKIKLIGRAIENENGTISAYVAPQLIPSDSMLAGVEDVMNGIVVKGNAIGTVMFYGAGAGKMPTASAVVADVIDISRHVGDMAYYAWNQADSDFVEDSDGLETPWYIRKAGEDTPVFTEPMSYFEAKAFCGEEIPEAMFRVIE